MIRQRLRRLLGGSLRRQVMIAMVLTVSLLMSLFVWDTTRRHQAVVTSHQTEQALAIARSVAVSGATLVAARDVSGLQEIVQGLASYPDLRYALVLSLQGQVLAHTEPERRGLYLTDMPTVAGLVVQQNAADLVEVAMPILLNDRPIGWVRAGLSAQSLQARLAQVRHSGMVYTVMAVLLTIVVAGAVSSWLTRRLAMIAQGVRAVHAGGDHVQVVVEGEDEAAQLGHQFNAMLDALAQRDRALKNSEAFKTAILDSVAAEIAVLDRNGTIVAVNEHWRLFALDNSAEPGHVAARTEVGTNYLQVCAQPHAPPDPDAMHAADGIRAVLDGRVPHFSLQYPCHAPEQQRWFTMMVRPLGSAGQEGVVDGVVITHTDISAIKLVENESQYRNLILEQLANGADVPTLMQTMASGLEQLQPGCWCRVALLSEDGQHIGHSVSPSLPGDVKQALDAARPDAEQTACASAVFSLEPVVVTDMAAHPDPDGCHALAHQAGLAAFWSQPVLSSASTLLGAISGYSHHRRTPLANELAVAAESARLLAVAIEHRATQGALVASENTFRTLFETAPVGVLYQNAQGLITSANPAAQRILGLTLAQLQGRTSMDPRWRAVHEDGSDFPGDQHPITLARTHGKPVRDVLMGIDVPERGQAWILVSAIPLFNAGKLVAAYAVFEDLTERHVMQQQIRQLAFFDPLTQLPNRRLLTDRLSQALSVCKRTAQFGAMMFLDLDNFKPLNDQHGHEVGDLLLVEVAHRLKACVREMDTVARLGGDEFVVILVALHADAQAASAAAGAVAEKIRTSLASPYRLTFQSSDGSTQVVEHHCSASIGLTLFSQNDSAHEPVLQRADDAMYQAKARGRNQVCVDSANFWPPDAPLG